MRTPSAGFILEKNKEENQPINLYRVDMTELDELDDLFLAEYDEDVAYFKETTPDVYVAQTYTKFPIRTGDVSENIEGRVDAITISVGNVSREISGYLELYDGLRGRKVTRWQVFANLLDDNQAYIEDIYYIDTVLVTNTVVSFTLTSKLNVLDIHIPIRKYNRDFCSWVYKGRGCWLETNGSFAAPTGFLAGDPDSCNKTRNDCIRHVNLKRMGCFPGVPSRRTM